MVDLLPESAPLRITQSPAPLSAAGVDRCEHLLLLVPASAPASLWDELPYGSDVATLLPRVRRRTAVPAIRTRLANSSHTGVSVALVEDDGSPFKRLVTARRLVADGDAHNPASIALAIAGFDAETTRQLAEAVVAAALAASFELPSLKSGSEPGRRLRSLALLGLGRRLSLDRLRAEAEGNNLGRWLTALPPNELDSRRYLARITALAERHDWKLSFHDRAALRRRKAGAFLAVAQGGPDDHAGIVHLRYRPRGRGRPALALVGKGICFDTGGVNLKTAAHMQNMHDDMAGSAVALGVLLSLTLQGYRNNVDCWLAITENRIGPAAYQPMDVVTAADGTTIEVIHTDAEGRMVLADTLALAAREKPGVVIDYATLTGACVVALTSRYSGVFTNRAELHQPLIAAGSASGERVWPFPVDEDFDEALVSTIADVKQCSLDGGGDHILAARFLGRFVGERPWVHMDLAAARNKGGLGHVATDQTGFGVRFTLNLLHEQQLLDVASR